MSICNDADSRIAELLAAVYNDLNAGELLDREDLVKRLTECAALIQTMVPLSAEGEHQVSIEPKQHNVTINDGSVVIVLPDKWVAESYDAAIDERDARIAELEQEIKNLAPTGMFNGIDIYGWKAKADAAQERLQLMIDKVVPLLDYVDADKVREGHRRKCGIWKGNTCDCTPARLITELRSLTSDSGAVKQEAAPVAQAADEVCIWRYANHRLGQARYYRSCNPLVGYGIGPAEKCPDCFRRVVMKESEK